MTDARKDTPARIETPATLDLVRHAELGLNALCRTVDPADDYMQYFHVFLNARPPYLQHHGADIQCTPKFALAIPLLRLMCGSDRHTDIEQAIQDSLVGYLCEEDGLYYAKVKPGRPWHMQIYGGEPVTEDAAQPQASGMMMLQLMQRGELEGTARWDPYVARLARGLEAIAVHKDDYAYYPIGGPNNSFCRPRSGWLNTAEPMGEHEGGERSVVAKHGYSSLGLATWAERTGDARALEFAGKLVRFMLKPKFWGGVSDAPQCSGRERGHADSHFHARAQGLRGALQYGLTAGDPGVCEFVRSAYDYWRLFGIPELGFIPTYHQCHVSHRGYMEGCFLRDVVWIGVKLSEAGYGDYWEDLDRLVRNHLVESQLTDKSIIERIVEHSPEREPGSDYNIGQTGKPSRVHQFPNREYAGADVIERVHGTWASLLGPVSADHAWVMQCCSPNAALALYYAWDAAARYKAGHARVNLFLNRRAAWGDVLSHLPYQGRVEVRNRAASRLSVRVPPWVRRSGLALSVDDEPRVPEWCGSYAQISGLAPGSTVTLDFDLPDRTVTATAHSDLENETACEIRLRGNTVLDVTPPDERLTSYPFYRRDRLRLDEPATVTARRHVPPVSPSW
ncbi:hypothetical protein ACFLSJ_08385 [Verrucomicrobiota bacterium]